MISSITRKLKFAKFYTGAGYHRDSTKFQSDTSYHRDSTKFQSGASYQLNSSKPYSETSFSRGLPHFAAVSYAESAGKAQSGEKPTLFYTDTLRGFRAQGCASDRHKAPRSSLEEARWGDWRSNRRAGPKPETQHPWPCEDGFGLSRSLRGAPTESQYRRARSDCSSAYHREAPYPPSDPPVSC